MTRKRFWSANDLPGTRDFLGYMILYAPEFPAEDQMTLERAFEELEHGLSVSGAGSSRMTTVLKDAYAAFQGGDREHGTRLLQEADGLL